MPDGSKPQEGDERRLPYGERPDGPRTPPDLVFLYRVRTKSRSVVTEWDKLAVSHKGNLLACFDHLATHPNDATIDPDRCHQLKPSRYVNYIEYWQYEVGGGARVWYLVDEDQKRVEIHKVFTGHPKVTEP